MDRPGYRDARTHLKSVVVVTLLLIFRAFLFYGLVIAEVGDGGGVGVGFLVFT